MVSWLKLLHVVLVLHLVFSAKLKNKMNDQLPTTVLEANHFFSSVSSSTVYKIEKVNVDLSLVVVLRPKDNEQFSNPTQITLISGSNQASCQFHSFYQLCVLQKITQLQTTMKIKCDHTPCEVFWTIYQAPTNTLDHKNIQTLNQLYTIDQTNNHAIAMITCNKPNFSQLVNSVNLYSESNFTKVYTNNVLYFLIYNQKKGHLFFKYNDDVKACGSLVMYQVAQKMTQDTLTRDFIVSSQKSIFKLSETPRDHFRIDCSMHQLLTQATKSTLQIEVTGQRGSSRQLIQKTDIYPYSQKQTFQFSYVVSKVSDEYKNIQFEFKSTDKILMLNAQLSLLPTAEVERGQVSFFTLKKGQQLMYQIKKQPDASPTAKTFITPSFKSKFKLSLAECKTAEGCNFTVKAQEDVDVGNIYISSQENAVDGEKQVTYEMGRTVTKKIAQSDRMYFTKTIKAQSNVQVVVNTPNVIIYAANKKKCPSPNEECYEKVGNNHHAFIYKTDQETQLIIGVLGLDNCVFTLNVILQNDEYIQLQDSIAFSYEMDDQENELIFKFTLKQKEPVAFNLISSLHSLNMIVSNSKQPPKGDQTDLNSIDGYLFLTAEQVTQLQFTIVVQKTPTFKDKFLHFSIIASTNSANMQLQSSISHYETLATNTKRQFAFEFDTKQQYIVNFYVHNAVGQKLQITLDVANTDNNWSDKSVKTFDIDQPTDKLDLKDISKELCQKEGQTSCEIFLRITNHMDRQIDISITLIVAQSIIQLKDGLWQSYNINNVSSTSHFYFFPRHHDKSVAILYKSNFPDLRLGYSIWKAQDKGINPIQWPFPVSTLSFNQSERFSYRPTKHISLNKQSFKQCWPSCVILISLIKDLNNNLQYQSIGGIFSILASNNFLEIPQKTKIDVVLEPNEEKFFLVDLKSVVVKDALTIFTSATMGYPNLSGTVYSQKNPRCPTDSESDFEFGRLQTQIRASTVKDKLQKNDMQDHNNVYLCILAQSSMESKFYIEWTSDDSMIKVLELDSFESIKVNKGDKKIYQITPKLQEYQLKFARTRGYPYIQIVNCKGQNKGYQQCLDSFDGSAKTQMLRKTELFSQPPCQNCIVFVQITSEQPAELDLHVQSKYSQVQIKENHIVSDFTEKEEVNKYIISYLSDKQTIISLHVLEGQPQITISDFHSINIKKTQPKGSNLIHITIPPVKHLKPTQKLQSQKLQFQQDNLQASMLGITHFGPTGVTGNIKFLHILVKSVQPIVACSYTITYSSGQRETYLQDGLALDYTLQSKKQTIFYYENVNEKSNAFLTISMGDSAALYNLKMKMYYYTDPEDEDTKVQFTPQKPPMRKKTPNPTIVFNLPSNHKLFSFVFENPNISSEKITMVINHLQVILLPYNLQFPFQLAARQSLNFIVDAVNVGYIQISIRKCDDSNPQFSYTFDEPSFQKDQYSYSTTLDDDPHFEQVVKVNEVGAIYMGIKSVDQPSILSIKVIYSNTKIKPSKVKPGNRGVLEYQLLNSQEAEISFTGAVCQGKCPNDISFYTMSSTQMQTLYTQTVCPSNFFTTNLLQSMKPLNLVKIQSTSDSSNKVTFTYKLLDHISYLSVKGVFGATGEEIYYRPVEIITLWGQLTRTSQAYKFILAGICICFVCILVICVRRNARKGYQELKQERQ